MRSTRILCVGLCISLMFTAAVALGQKVKTESAPGVVWSSYHTFSWAEGTPARNPEIAQKIVSGIESRLAARGLTKVEKDGDLVVMYHAAKETDQSINRASYGDWVGWDKRAGWGAPGMGTAYVETVIIGELKVEIADRNAKKFLWRSDGSDAIDPDPKKVAKTIDKVLNKMFGKFPPK